MDIKKCYEILELDPEASLDDVKQAYKDLVQHRNPCPLGKVRVQWLCHLNDSFATTKASCPHNFSRGVTNEPISETITNHMALPISHCLGAQV